MAECGSPNNPVAAPKHDEARPPWIPERYGDVWGAPFLASALSGLRPGSRILDVGSGARPVISRELLPNGCTYAGLDISGEELERAEVGAYDEIYVGDICGEMPAIARRFDLVVSWQVLEHVTSMHAALATQRAALVPGGRMVAMLSGGWALHSLAARIIPYRVSTWLQFRLLHSPPEDKFPTRFDGCTDRALRGLLADGGWTSWEVVPRYGAGVYLSFSRPLQRAYLVYENWAARGPRANLATHYIVHATAS